MQGVFVYNVVMKIYTAFFGTEEEKNTFIADTLRAETGTEPEIIRLPSGKKVLAGGKKHFSLAHSGRLLVLAVADKEVGVDVERLRPFPPNVRRSRFMRECPDGEREAFVMWTRLEAAVKCTGEGVGAMPDVDLDGFEWHETESIFDGKDEYILSVCTRKD